jgi:hypothetical protein
MHNIVDFNICFACIHGDYISMEIFHQFPKSYHKIGTFWCHVPIMFIIWSLIKFFEHYELNQTPNASKLHFIAFIEIFHLTMSTKKKKMVICNLILSLFYGHIYIYDYKPISYI